MELLQHIYNLLAHNQDNLITNIIYFALTWLGLTCLYFALLIIIFVTLNRVRQDDSKNDHD